ncbi:MAG: hypothetical protein AB7I27_10470 [Bacteriovoracaceae bacterium]
MIKKIFAYFMIASLFIVQANAATANGLKAAYDELNYSLIVEWDQKDKGFYTEKMKEFSSVIRDLQAKGLTNSELLAFVKSEVKDARVARDLEATFNLIQLNKMSAADASKFMLDNMKNTRSTGASWNSEATYALAIILLIVAVASAGGGSSNPAPSYACTSYYVCSPVCYYDYYWGYTCYDDCYYSCY